ncbi:hypothetical protein CCHR01_10659 [Colletotrichum chrysophilum]|uniref:Cyanovirin-N domain-containing protein n=1 Tax=Colletotrichum chrysophilum TaxID=1836956 RepID=A0AAD9AEL9_9PEZI|nr:hypothetical protein CCHR01_10659 [Colletotrichum chrysophilum]
MKLSILSPVLLAAGALAALKDHCQFIRHIHAGNSEHPTVEYNCPSPNPVAWPYRACWYVDLGKCFINDMGQIRAQKDGAFSRSCRECTFNSSTEIMRCRCDIGTFGTWRYSEVNINSALEYVSTEGVGCYGEFFQTGCQNST